jgi:hypothetical protein
VIFIARAYSPRSLRSRWFSAVILSFILSESRETLPGRLEPAEIDLAVVLDRA